MNTLCSLASVLVLSFAALTSLGVEPPVAVPQQATSSYGVEVSLDGQDLWVASLQNANLIQVRKVVAGALLAAPPTADSVQDLLQDALVRVFPGSVSLSQPAAKYKAVWCEEEGRFVFKCCLAPYLLVKLGVDTVRVTIPIGIDVT